MSTLTKSLSLTAFFAVISLAMAQAQTAPSSSKDAYEKLVQGARVEKGYVAVLEKDGKVYLEFPTASLDKDILWYVEFSRAPATLSQSTGLEIADKMVRFRRRGATLFVDGRKAALGRRLR